MTWSEGHNPCMLSQDCKNPIALFERQWHSLLVILLGLFQNLLRKIQPWLQENATIPYADIARMNINSLLFLSKSTPSPQLGVTILVRNIAFYPTN